MDDLTAAKRLLDENPENTCALSLHGKSAVSRGRGISPLLSVLDGKENWKDACAADTVVGRAAALLYCLIGVRAVYARVAEDGAAKVFEERGIELVFERRTENIINRKGTGMCPMNVAVRNISSPKEAYAVLKEAYDGESAKWLSV